MGDLQTRLFGVFLGLGAIAFAFGDTVLPEVQVKLVHLTLLLPSAIAWLHVLNIQQYTAQVVDV